MPNISAHLIVGREVGKRLNINSDDFMRGNVLPDVIDMKDSHHKIKKGIYFIPNILKRFICSFKSLIHPLYIKYRYVCKMTN